MPSRCRAPRSELAGHLASAFRLVLSHPPFGSSSRIPLSARPRASPFRLVLAHPPFGSSSRTPSRLVLAHPLSARPRAPPLSLTLSHPPFGSPSRISLSARPIARPLGSPDRSPSRLALAHPLSHPRLAPPLARPLAPPSRSPSRIHPFGLAVSRPPFPRPRWPRHAAMCTRIASRINAISLAPIDPRQHRCERAGAEGAPAVRRLGGLGGWVPARRRRALKRECHKVVRVPVARSMGARNPGSPSIMMISH